MARNVFHLKHKVKLRPKATAQVRKTSMRGGVGGSWPVRRRRKGTDVGGS